MQYSWPDHFPEACPPESSEEINGRIYRFVAGVTPAKDDFVSSQLQNPRKAFGRKACQACGLSVYRDWSCCIHYQKAIPALRKKRIAFGDLKPEHGVIMQTPSKMAGDHHTWWLPNSMPEPEGLFEIAEEGT